MHAISVYKWSNAAANNGITSLLEVPRDPINPPPRHPLKWNNNNKTEE